MGKLFKLDEGNATNVSNIFACGDAARAVGNVTLAAADRVMAGVEAHRASMV